MGARGLKPGFKRTLMGGAATPLSSMPALATPEPLTTAADAESADAPASTSVPAEPERVIAVDLENPEKLTGQALRDLAHRRGLARSAIADMPDAKIRMELLYITNRQYGEEGIA